MIYGLVTISGLTVALSLSILGWVVLIAGCRKLFE